ncbi:hypothetical protein GpartN1_g4929.t1 [Galdieria partita]|uniref:Uncharacterized protein n=1 Tax=Galdieria partita TaxID=83374 RepID=A0A9C7PYA4_9RHOD|nr:hypothetical protein GpartN1_g4929.t1 [Galdieria partita]
MWHSWLGARQWIPKQLLVVQLRQYHRQVSYSSIKTEHNRLYSKRQLSDLNYSAKNKLLHPTRSYIDEWRRGSMFETSSTSIQWLSLKTCTQSSSLLLKNNTWRTTARLYPRSPYRPCTTVPAKEESKQESEHQQKTKEPQFLIYDAKKGWHFFFLTFLSSSQLGIWLAEKLEGTKRKDDNPSLLARNISGIASVVGLVCLLLVFWYSRNFISEMWIVGHSAQKLIIRTYTIIGTKTAPTHLLTKSVVKGRSKKNSNYVGIKFKGAKFSYILDKGGRFIANEELLNSFENGASAVFVTWSRVYPTLKHSAT